jgi:hypothetical protein
MWFPFHMPIDQLRRKEAEFTVTARMPYPASAIKEEKKTKLSVFSRALRSNRHQLTMRTIEIALNESARRCLVLESPTQSRFGCVDS